LTLLVDLGKKTAVPLDDALPTREMKEIQFTEVTELTPPVPDNIALLQVAPIGEIIDGLGVNRGEGVFLVCEI
jgi:hypothetical protein